MINLASLQVIENAEEIECNDEQLEEKLLDILKKDKINLVKKLNKIKKINMRIK